MRPAVALVRGGAQYGSGVVWGSDGEHVLTALHVVEQMPEIWVSLAGEDAVRARIVDAEPALDLALLRTERPLPGTPPALRLAVPAAGASVTLVGHPGGRAGAATGPVVDPARRFAGARYVEIGVLAEPGASGGPVIDARGAVVGIVDLALTDRGRTLAIPIDAALARFPDGASQPP